MKGILGKKLGMTQVFTEDGKLIPVTVIEVEPNVVMQVKTKETDGYDAVQLGFQSKREKVSNKAEIGHSKKANTEPKRFLREIKGINVEDYKLGDVLTVDTFEAGEMVDVSGISKGKGFQGSIKRHGFKKGPMAHGSKYHRGVGSLGSMRPKRVFKGTELPGHMGNVLRTVQNLVIVDVIKEDNVILVKGNVPGPKKSMVFIKTAVKNPNTKIEIAELVNYIEEEPEENTEVKEEVAEEVETKEEETKEEATEESKE